MDFQSPEQIKQYLLLSKKSRIELQAIANGLQLNSEGTEQELLCRLMNVAVKQIPKFSAQMFALSAASDESRKLLQTWRTKMFKKGTVQALNLMHLDGKQETIMRKSFSIAEKDIKILMQLNMVKVRSFQTELFDSIKSDAARYNSSIFLNSDKNGNAWLMLHVNPR